ncbi:hypothetical protein CBR_g678 [Chara braunii]|uniref:Uncharacterized protein n=1 Tax=Chara braunii TaxID=69332 RepID=A0A388KC04_CHABU|nr:hypothetical protein CBR_g678 [Chara braunii]|eukprot:GBG67547.1 hypothetical protein CBR_g678 [Chara braunii]
MGGLQGDPELEEIKEQFRLAKKKKMEQEEKRRKEEEKRIGEEEETRRNLDFARKVEEFKLQLRAELLEEWRKNHADAVKSTEKIGKSAKKTKKKKKRYQKEHGGPKRRRAQRSRRRDDSSEDSESSCSTDDESNTSDDTSSGSESGGKITRNKMCVRRGMGNTRTKAKTKNNKGKGRIEEMRTPIRTYEKGESSRARKQPQAEEEEMLGTKSPEEVEPKTPLTGGFKGLAAGCSQKGLIEYCISAHKIYSAKKADALRKICEQKGIKYTKKPEIVEILARHQVQLAYDGFDEEQGFVKNPRNITRLTKANSMEIIARAIVEACKHLKGVSIPAVDLEEVWSDRRDGGMDKQRGEPAAAMDNDDGAPEADLIREGYTLYAAHLQRRDAAEALRRSMVRHALHVARVFGPPAGAQG